MPRKETDLPFGYCSILSTYLIFVILVIIGHLRDQMGKIFTPWAYRQYMYTNNMPPLFTSFDSFFIRRFYTRISDCWNRPIHGLPGRKIKILERVSNDYNKTFTFTNNEIKVLNIGSYNYLGLAKNKGNIVDKVLETVDKYDINYAFPTADYSQNELSAALEKDIASFLSREDAIVFSMGYGTNVTAIHALMQDSLILSDEHNHASLIKGMKLSQSKIDIYKHNDLSSLESKLKFYITQGQPEIHRPWKRIFVVVEGMYSMEGTIVALRRLVELKKKYKFYIFMDEAHSMGAMGRTGRGICEHCSVAFTDVDILMGTFTKSFGGFGGYIAGNKEMIDTLRKDSDFALYAEQMAPAVTTQIHEALKQIQKDTSAISTLHENTRLLRDLLKKQKLFVLGDRESPIIPILFPTPSKIGEFSRLCLEKGVAVVVVGYPATPILLNRVRLCMSAALKIKDIEYIAKVIEHVSNLIGMSE